MAPQGPGSPERVLTRNLGILVPPLSHGLAAPAPSRAADPGFQLRFR